MLANFFALIQLILKALSLWESFLDWQEEKNIAIRNEKAIAREAALRALISAETDEDIWKHQEDIVKNRPQP